MRVVYSPLAARELVAETAKYEGEAAGLGALFLDELDAATAQIVKFPKSGPRYGDKFRRVLLRRFPLSIIYEVSRERLRIAAIMHQHRGPEFIAKRLAKETAADA